MRKFCPRCGKETEKFYDKVCKDCFLLNFSVIKKLPDKILVKKCRSCNKYIHDKPVSSIDEFLDFYFSELLKQKEVKNVFYEIQDDKVAVYIKIRVDDAEKTEQKVLSLIPKTILCKFCNMKFSGYFQSILQIRAPEKLLSLLQNEIENQIEFFNKFDELAFISKIERIKSGFDVYVGSKLAATQIAKKLKSKYKAKIKVSRKLSGSIRGKKVYRDTILITIGEVNGKEKI
jgi:nonsense-mediated mRNA decay protein 3